ncbi:MAG: hypothetical protein IKJ82_02545 [Oscillospiraceae bacterium]|nr:hypothetical protein [Oscillospiraceae bacterium]
MNSSKGHKMPVPHNGKKVNDWETLRPYVEMSAPPKEDNISERNGEAIIDPKWGFGYQAEFSGNNSTFSPDEE